MISTTKKILSYLLFILITELQTPVLSFAYGTASLKSFWSWVFKIINILIFLFIVKKIGKNKIKEFFIERRQNKEDEIFIAEKKEKDAFQLFELWSGKLISIEAEAKRILETSINEGLRIKEEIIKEAQKEANLILEQAKESAYEEVMKIKKRLAKELAKISIQNAEEYLRKNLTPEHQKSFIDKFLIKIEHLK